MPASRATSFDLIRIGVPSAGAPSGAPPPGAWPDVGWQIGHTDSGKPCSAQKSPFALNDSISEGLHFVHFDSGTPCSLHQSAAFAAGTADGAPAPGGFEQ